MLLFHENSNNGHEPINPSQHKQSTPRTAAAECVLITLWCDEKSRIQDRCTTVANQRKHLTSAADEQLTPPRLYHPSAVEEAVRIPEALLFGCKPVKFAERAPEHFLLGTLSAAGYGRSWSHPSPDVRPERCRGIRLRSRCVRKRD